MFAETVITMDKTWNKYDSMVKAQVVFLFENNKMQNTKNLFLDVF